MMNKECFEIDEIIPIVNNNIYPNVYKRLQTALTILNHLHRANAHFL